MFRAARPLGVEAEFEGELPDIYALAPCIPSTPRTSIFSCCSVLLTPSFSPTVPHIFPCDAFPEALHLLMLFSKTDVFFSSYFLFKFHLKGQCLCETFLYILYIYIYFFVEPYMSETFLYILFCFIWPCILVNCLNVCTSPAHHQIVNILIVLKYYICLHFSSCPACRRYPNKHLLSEFPGER